MKADGGVYLFCKLLRNTITGENKEASGEAFRKWLEDVGGFPPSYCSGSILEVPEGATLEEVQRHRDVAEQMIEALTESNQYTGEKRNKFVIGKFNEIESNNR
jgi:hypothetical protein